MAVIDVIKYEGPNSLLVWKFDGEDFNTASQLIVHESQEAIFFKDGQALDLFGPGRYTLQTQNIPLLNKLVNLPFGGVSPFHCEVYFINKTEEMAIRWGTDKRVSYVDQSLNPPLPLSIGAAGELTIAVEDARKLVVKLVGTEAALDQQHFISYMRSIINMTVKPMLARIMQTGEYSIFNIDAAMDSLASELHQRLIPEFADYGIELRRFMVTSIAKPEDDPVYQRYYRALSDQTLNVLEAQARQNEAVKEAETLWKVAQQEAQKTVIDAQAQSEAKVIDARATAEKRKVEGYTYQQERGFDVGQTVAANSAVGEFTNMGIGMGMISGIGGTLSGTVAGMANDAISASAAGGDRFGADPSLFVVGAASPVAQTAGGPGKGNMPDAVSPEGSPSTGAPSQAAFPQGTSSQEDALADMKLRIEKLKLMHESGLIDDAEFEQLRRQMISEI